jgi:hypothetical protein
VRGLRRITTQQSYDKFGRDLDSKRAPPACKFRTNLYVTLTDPKGAFDWLVLLIRDEIESRPTLRIS